MNLYYTEHSRGLLKSEQDYLRAEKISLRKRIAFDKTISAGILSNDVCYFFLIIYLELTLMILMFHKTSYAIIHQFLKLSSK